MGEGGCRASISGAQEPVGAGWGLRGGHRSRGLASARVRLASLPWYDLAEVRGAHDALWSAVAGRLRAAGVDTVPERLERGVDYRVQWRSGRLLLGQACGYDVAAAQARALRVVATPRFDVEGCVGARYRSFVVVRRRSAIHGVADLRGGRCVINTETSHSGMNALRRLVAPLRRGGPFFGEVLVSGAHERSVEVVASGAADVAAIDCISYALLARHRPAALADLRILCRTELAPAPPFVTSAATPAWQVEAIRVALDEVLTHAPDPAPWSTLPLRGVSVLPRDAYASLVGPAPAAAGSRQATRLEPPAVASAR